MALSQIYHQQRQSDDLDLEGPVDQAASLPSPPDLPYHGQGQSLEQGPPGIGGLRYEWNSGQN